MICFLPLYVCVCVCGGGGGWCLCNSLFLALGSGSLFHLLKPTDPDSDFLNNRVLYFNKLMKIPHFFYEIVDPDIRQNIMVGGGGGGWSLGGKIKS